jgi:hypothetical protein
MVYTILSLIGRVLGRAQLTGLEESHFSAPYRAGLSALAADEVSLAGGDLAALSPDQAHEIGYGMGRL